MAEGRAGRWLGRLTAWASLALVVVASSLAILVPTAYVTVEKTSEPPFCRTCHLMDPYYDSWERSAHAGVKCTECHFEPGTLGTVRGKFQALTQLAKYVTRTAGTRPWADVSDASCVRSGCHASASLEGPIAFDGVRFDHGPHLLEPRGQRLRCVTCHSQVLVDRHFAVEPSVCFTCHFHPGADGRAPARTSECTTCHAPPAETLTVAGRPFDHDAFLRRGVACQECHAGAVAGAGTVHDQRCRSCHGEPEILARRGDTALMHRAHVTDKKVECSECHVEIVHGLEAVANEHPAGDGGCSACHDGPHDAARLVLAGRGVEGVESHPSRMAETHVACAACHTGRLGGADGAHGGLARAGEADCLHCHGTDYAGMLAEWQGAVGDGLTRLRELERSLGAGARDAPARRAELDAAGEALALLERDGSRGAHNAPYALAVLRSAAERLDRARAGEDGAPAPSAALALPPPADAGCAACHVDVARRDPLSVHGRDFLHERHLRGAGLTCATCHASEPHGAPAFPRDTCGSCHHAESETRDPSACEACHALQESFLHGTVAGLEPMPSEMSEKGCTECHGEPPDVLIPPSSLCVLCHEEGYDQRLEAWRSGTDERVERLRRALATPSGAPAAREAAQRALALVDADGSRGVHNAGLVQHLLDEALAGLGER